MPLYIGWCFLDLKWTFYRALLPIYIKNDSGVYVTDLAHAAILTDSCQVFVLQLYLCNDSVLIMLYYDHCPVPMYLNCSDYFVFISLNEILDTDVSQTIALVCNIFQLYLLHVANNLGEIYVS